MDYAPICGLVLQRTTSPPPKLELELGHNFIVKLRTFDDNELSVYGIVVEVHDDPLTVRLLFEPSGRPVDEQSYYLSEKDNVCVVCGSDESYIRKNIIPREYRKYVSVCSPGCRRS